MLQVRDPELDHDLSDGAGPLVQSGKHLRERVDVPDPAGPDRLRQLRQATHDSDLQVIGPKGRRELGGDRGQDRDARRRVAVDGERAGVLEVEQHMRAVEVVAQGDQARERGGDLAELLGRGQGRVGRQGPDGRVAGGHERCRQEGRAVQVELEVVVDEPGHAQLGERLASLGEQDRQASQGLVDPGQPGRVLDHPQLELDGLQVRRGHGDPLARTAAALLPDALETEQREQTGGHQRTDTSGGPDGQRLTVCGGRGVLGRRPGSGRGGRPGGGLDGRRLAPRCRGGGGGRDRLDVGCRCLGRGCRPLGRRGVWYRRRGRGLGRGGGVRWCGCRGCRGCRAAGQGQLPAGPDEVRLGQVRPVVLQGGRGGGDVGVAVTVTEVVLGDLPERVAGFDDDDPPGWAAGAGRRGGVFGQGELPAGGEPVRAGQGVAVGLRDAVVELRDLAEPGAVAEAVGRDLPQGVAGLHGVGAGGGSRVRCRPGLLGSRRRGSGCTGGGAGGGADGGCGDRGRCRAGAGQCWCRAEERDGEQQRGCGDQRARGPLLRSEGGQARGG